MILSPLQEYDLATLLRDKTFSIRNLLQEPPLKKVLIKQKTAEQIIRRPGDPAQCGTHGFASPSHGGFALSMPL
jgi:hypothetical protein